MQHSTFPMRQVHLDFHTSPLIPDVGADWDPQHFAQTLKRAHVNSVTLFAKCHHGMNYYPTNIGPVHPALTFDLLGEQIAACHQAGIRCPIYLSVCWDASAAERHPEWRQIDCNGRQVGAGPLEAHPFSWPQLCVNNAYTEELLAQTEELLARYECDGFFYDIVMYHPDGCFCTNCLRDMRAQGLDPQDPQQRQVQQLSAARAFMQRMTKAVRAKVPHAGIFYNSRWGLHFADEASYYSQVEVESLPTGGWGYGFYPQWSRYARTFDLPLLGMTGRFHRSWADWGGLKHPDALRFEAGTILSSAGAISIGDQLHPRGRLNSAVYEVIGEVFSEVEEIEANYIGAQAVPQIGLLTLDAHPGKALEKQGAEALEGASQMLLELHQLFDIITGACPDFQKYSLLIVPDQSAVTTEVAERLRRYLAAGGKLLLSHEALLNRESRNFWLADEIGADYQGPAVSNPDYFVLTAPELFTNVSRPDFPYSLYLQSTRVAPRSGTEILADVRESYFNRTWEHFSSHDFTAPRAEKANYPAITRSGNVIYIYGPVFTSYQTYGTLALRAVVERCLHLLLPQPLVETNAPATTEVSLLRQGARDLVHLVNYHPQRRAPGHVEILEAPVPLWDVTINLRRTEPTQNVSLARGKKPLPFTQEGGVISVVIPRIDIYELVIFE